MKYAGSLIFDIRLGKDIRRSPSREFKRNSPHPGPLFTARTDYSMSTFGTIHSNTYLEEEEMAEAWEMWK